MLGNFLLSTDFCTVYFYRKQPSLPIFRPSCCFLMLQTILLIIFEFLRASYTRIYSFQKCFDWEFFYYGPIYEQGPVPDHGYGGPEYKTGRGTPLQREAPELNRLGVQGRAQAPLAPPEAKNLVY
jgi:hypothetical protein